MGLFRDKCLRRVGVCNACHWIVHLNCTPGVAGAPWTGMLDVYDTPLPRPMITGANAGDTECLLDEDFKDLATSHNVRVTVRSTHARLFDMGKDLR